MKFKCFVIFAALIFAVSCGGGSNGNNQNENPDSGDTVTDGDVDSGDSGSADTDPSDSGHENPDTAPEQPDNGDSQPDGGDTAPDNGDTTPDGGDTTPDEGDSAPDNGDSEPDEDADSTPGLPDQDPAPVIEMEEGIYLGIIGFNDDLTKKPIKRLTDANKSEFKSFINSLTQLNLTALYWADYSALEMMESFTISPDLQLKKVALVTFTDGLDNQSLSSDDFNPGPYDTHAEYLDAIHSMIMDEAGIHGVPVTAYSIGLKGSDVTDEAKFENTLEKLATEETGDEKFVFQVTDMNEVGQHFADIAASLYSVSTTINVGVYIPGGYDNGQVIRYTFDNVSAATNSNLYIEATYHRSGTSRTLENIQYEGFIPGASTISSSATGPHNELYFQFNDLKYSNGDPVSQSEIISKSRLWKQTSSGAWDGETEMNMAELPPIIDEDKSSALIMLVLDSTTSLGSDFSRMQNEAKNFVEILVNGGSGVTESSPCDDNPCATLANSTHICTVNGANYVCGCNSGYNWNGWQCTSPSTPCNPNPCTSISNSTGVCTVSGTGYICGCQSGYTWNGGSCAPSSNPNTITIGNICTGQTSCYDNEEEITCPSLSSADFYGQDAQYTNKCTAQSFSSSSNVVIDNNTGLTWEKSPSSSEYTWENRATHCNDLNSSNYGGINTWRVPNPLELHTIVNNSTYNPATNSNFTGMQTSWSSIYLWTNNEYKGDTSSAYMFDPFYGGYWTGNKTGTYKVLCVSGEEMKPAVSSDFTTSSDGKTVTDNRTGLMWQKEYATGKTWQQALKYCEDLSYAGYTDWRLPNKNELASLVNYEKSGYPYSYFPDMPGDYFWSSSTRFGSAGYARYVDINGGAVLYTNKTSNLNVRCVRDSGDTVPGDTGDTDPTDTGDTVPGDTGDTAPAETLTLGNICTGQTSCYNASSSMTCPSSSSANFFGQDAQYTNKCTAQSFSASSNVVIDNNTGLTWEKSPSSSFYTWANRNMHCSDLNSSNYGGISNWRVPNPLELLTIVNNSTYNPATNSNFTGMPTSNSTYLWTNNEYKGDTGYAYYFSPSYGWYSYDGITYTYKVLCVSGEEMKPAVSSDFTTSSDGKTVTDNRTGLMWQKEYATGKTWQQALKYCEDLSYAGYTDWRLPNKNELASLVNYEKSGYPYSYFPDMPSSYFWSSSTHVRSTNLAWNVYFGYGYVDDLSKISNYNVRCVR